MPLVSIIIPVYNVSSYLDKCLKSIVNQTLKDIEIILIDDGSSDDSGKICDIYAQHDNRIRVIHKNNEGLSQARNDGIRASTSPYIMFVDSDDWVDIQFCELPYKYAIDNDADLVLFLYYKCFENSVIKRHYNIKSGIITEKEAIYFNVYYAPASWLGLYKKSLFNDIKFPYKKLFEDVGTSHKLIHNANRICIIDKCLYFYRMARPGSIMTNLYYLEHPDYKEMRINKIEDLYRWGYKELIQEDAFSLLIKYGYQDKIMKGIFQIVSEISREIPNSFCLKRKFLLWVFKFSPKIFDIACICLGRRR